MKHQHISFLKSFIRIAGYMCLTVHVGFAVTVLAISEVIGVLEEVGHE